MTISFSVNSIDTKFQTLLEEIKEIKSDIKTKEINALQINPTTHTYGNTNDQRYLTQNQMPQVPYGRAQQTYQPRRYQNYSNQIPMEYTKPRIIDRSVNNPRLQNLHVAPDVCTKCGYSQCRDGRNLINDVIIVNNLTNIHSMCFRTCK